MCMTKGIRITHWFSQPSRAGAVLITVRFRGGFLVFIGAALQCVIIISIIIIILILHCWHTSSLQWHTINFICLKRELSSWGHYSQLKWIIYVATLIALDLINSIIHLSWILILLSTSVNCFDPTLCLMSCGVAQLLWSSNAQRYFVVIRGYPKHVRTFLIVFDVRHVGYPKLLRVQIVCFCNQSSVLHFYPNE